MISQNQSGASQASSPGKYSFLVLFTAGFGGLLYGVDVGIIAAALLYLGKTIQLNVTQTSLIVAAVLGGSMVSSPLGGLLADWLGRKKTMVIGGLMFLVSVVCIIASTSFAALFVGRLLQGMSGGIIAVVVPLFLAEGLDARMRGRGTALFQLMLTVGIALAALVGWLYTRQAEAVIAAANGNAAVIFHAQQHAWRGMFLATVYPGIAFVAGSLFLSESPRWLIRKNRLADALKSLRRGTASNEEAEARLAAIREADLQLRTPGTTAERSDSLLQRRYVVPFVLACLVLTLNQTTGINTILAFLVVILQHAGLSAVHATQGDVVVKVLNTAVTLVAIQLIDRKGRKFLLKIGTACATLALLAAAVLLLRFESGRIDATEALRSSQQGNGINFPVRPIAGGNVTLTVLYHYNSGTQLASASSASAAPVLAIAPAQAAPQAPLTVEHAFYTREPAPWIGWATAAALAVFIAGYAIGPGVVVWLILSELMPTRIRSRGMGIALLFNQGMSTLIASLFLPVVGRLGYYAMFAFWAICTTAYFLVTYFLLPETKDKTLEEIEASFATGRTLDATT